MANFPFGINPTRSSGPATVSVIDLTGSPWTWPLQERPDYAEGLLVFVDFTDNSSGAGTLTVVIEGLDEVSGLFYTILTSAALAVAASTLVVMRIHPSLTAATNIAKDALPRVWRVKTTHSDAASAYSYTTGYSYVA